MEQFLSPKLLEALEFSALAHHGQLRKNSTNIPYFSHPAAVAIILSQAGFPEEVVIAGALHDVIEDTKYTAEDIKKRFGERILQIVLSVTENKDLDWSERNEAYNNHLREVDEATLAVSAADFLSNRQSLLLELRKGNNPWVYFGSKPKEYAQKRLEFDKERLTILKQRLHHPLVSELEALENETINLTSKLSW